MCKPCSKPASTVALIQKSVIMPQIITSFSSFASVNLADNKNIFLICTYGGRPVFKSIEQVIAYKHDTIVGRFSCKGFDTFGPFKLIGGVSKGHPDEKDIAAAVEFYNGLKLKYY